jgi:hypothetical protein
MKTYGGADVQNVFFTLAPAGVEWLASCHGFTPGKGPIVPIGQEAGWTPELGWMMEDVANAL